MKILMVCLGNICRSPLAEGILQQMADENGLAWQVDSAGTAGYHIGNLPDARSIAVAQKHGLDITHQRARKFRSIDIDEYDLIFAMDRSNYRDINQFVQNDKEAEKVQLILNFHDDTNNLDVPDPYYDDNGFEHVYQLLKSACQGVIKKYSTTQIA